MTSTPSEKRYDVIIIGSGIAGALAALRLSREKQANILILEAGDSKRDRAKFLENYAVLSQKDKSPNGPYTKGATAANLYAPSSDPPDFSLYDPAKKQFFVQTGPDVFLSQYLRISGGTTWSWRGNSPRYLPSDFLMKTKFGVADDWPISYDDLEPDYCDAEDIIGVSGNKADWDEAMSGRRTRDYPQPGIALSFSDKEVKRRLENKQIEGKAIRVTTTPQARLSKTEPNKYPGRNACQGNHNCIPVCPSGAKYEANYTLDQLRTLSNVEIRDHSVVTQLQLSGDKRSVSKVAYKKWNDKGEILEESVSGRIVVLAANAIESAKLLLMSGVANSSDQVGRNLMDHLGGEGCALLPFKIYPFRGPQSITSIEAFRDGDFRKERCGFRLTVGNDGWGRTLHPVSVLEKYIKDQRLFGQQLNQKLHDHITCLFRFSYSTEQLPNPDNRITLSCYKDDLGIPKPQISYKVDDYSKNGIKATHQVMKQLFQALEANPATWQFTPIDPWDAKSYSGSGHIMGTCRMGNDPKTSVVNKRCRSHDVENLYIIGSSVFTTGSTANPTITIAAVSLYASRFIKEQLGQ